MTFAGSQWMETGSNEPLPADGAVTAYALVYWTSLPISNQTVVAMENPTDGRLWHLKGISGSSVQAANFSTAGAGGTDNAPGSLVANEWMVLVMRQDVTVGLECMLANAGQIPVSDGTTRQLPALSTYVNPLHVGCSQTATPSEPLSGSVGAVRLYGGRHNDLQVETITTLMLAGA